MPDYTNPCNKCGSQCTDDCQCNEPNYSPLGCKEHIPFKCVQLLEKNTNNSPISYPCIPFATNESLFTLTERIAAWKCQYDSLITKVRVSATDTAPGYLSDKIIVDDCVVKTIIGSGNNEKIRISIDYDCLLAKIIQLPGFCTAASSCTTPQCPAGTDLVIT